MNEIVIAWYPSVADLKMWATSITEFLWTDCTSILKSMMFWRLYAVTIGSGIVAHFWLMAYYGQEKAPLLLKVMVMASAFAGGHMISTAICGGPDWNPDQALYATPFIAFLLWIWDKGFHVCDLVDRLLHQQGNGAK